MTGRSGKRLLLAIVLIVLIGSLSILPVSSWVEGLAAWGRQHAIAGPLAYVVFVIIATTLFLPGSVAMMIGGFLFGFLPGVALAIVAIPVGAQCSFELGRWLVGPWIRRKARDMPRVQSIELALREEAFLIVVLTRLSLIIPFNVLNYVYGATSVDARTHFGATAIGMLPAIALFVYLGTLAHDLGQIIAGKASPPELGYWLLIGGLIAIGGATWVIHRAASRVLENHLEGKEGVNPES